MSDLVQRRSPPVYDTAAPRVYSAPPPSGPPRGDGTPIDVARLLATFRRRVWLVILPTLAFGAFAWQQVRSQPRLYRSTAVVQLVDARQALAGGLASSSDRSPYAMSVLSQIEILQSRAVAAAVVDSDAVGTRVQTVDIPLSLLENVRVTDSLASSRIQLSFSPTGIVVGERAVAAHYGDVIQGPEAQFAVSRDPGVTSGAIIVLPREAAIDRVVSSVAATPRRQTNLIDITFTAADPIVARRLVNRIAQSFQSVNARLAQQQSRRRRLFIEEQLAKSDVQLAEAERALSAFRTRQQAYSSAQKFASRQAEITELDDRRQDLQAERRMSGMLLEGVESDDPGRRRETLRMLASSPGVGQNPVVVQLYGQLVQYETSRAELTSGASGSVPSHPNVRRLDTLIAGTEGQLAAALQAHVALLDARIEALDEQRGRDARDLLELPAAEAEETRLAQNAAALREQGALLRSEYQQARISEAAEVGQVEIVDLATRSGVVQGSGGRLILFALFLGLVVGGGGAVALEGLDRTLKRREDVELALGRPVLATVPQITMITGLRQRALARFRRPRGRAETARRREVALASALHWRSPGAEAHRQLRTTLFRAHDAEVPRRVLVTSATEGEGKTSIAVNLGVTLAQQRMRVLLVDCDLHGPRLHRIFQLPQGPGLSEVLLSDMLPREALRATPVGGLYVITAGTLPENPGVAIASPRMRAMLNDLVQDFDVVILDSSPVLAVSDAAILSTVSDAVLIVVRAGKTSPTDVAEAKRQLAAVGAPVAGAVFNDPDGRVRQYGGYCYGYPRG